MPGLRPASIGVVWSRSQKAVSSWRSSSSTGFVSCSTNFRSATILSRSAGPEITASRPGTLFGSMRCPIPSFPRPRCRARSLCRCRRRVLGRRRSASHRPKSEGHHDDDHEGGDRPAHRWRSRRRERRRRCRRIDEATQQAVLDASAEVRRCRGARAAREAARSATDYAGTLRRRRRGGATGVDRAALTDEGITPVDYFADGDGHARALRRPRRRNGEVLLVATTFTSTSSGATAAGPLAVHRTNLDVRARDAGGIWLITAYRVPSSDRRPDGHDDHHHGGARHDPPRS